jgi:hypothetical protein
MILLNILDMDESMFFMVCILAAAISWAIFYYTIKAAVKFGILEANEAKEMKSAVAEVNRQDRPNIAQMDLQKRYDAGGMPFDEYLKEWDKLKT